MSSNTLEIIQGLAQAAANAYDGAHDERYSLDGQVRKVGLAREEGCPINDSRMMDGFNVKFVGDAMCISYQSDIRLKEVYAGGFEHEMEQVINDVKSFLQKEYKAITKKSVSLKKDRAGNKDAIPAQVLQARGRDRSEAPRDFSRDGAIRDGGRVLLSGSEINRDLSLSQDQGLGPGPQHDRQSRRVRG